MMTILQRLRADDRGATAIEYGLIATLVSIAAIVAMQNLGNELSATYNQVQTKVQAANQTNQ